MPLNPMDFEDITDNKLLDDQQAADQKVDDRQLFRGNFDLAIDKAAKEQGENGPTSAENNNLTHAEMQKIELKIGLILRLGVAVASSFMFIGFVMLLINGKSGYAGGYWPRHLAEILSGLIALRPFAWLMTGLFLLILTPVLRVIVSIYAFAKEHDRLYVWITTFVLIVLLIAMLVGNTI